MSEKEKPPTWGMTALTAAASLLPYGKDAALVVIKDVAARRAYRMLQTTEEIGTAVGIERLERRLADDPEFSAMFVNAIDAASRTGYEAKRRYLARVVANAAEDDADIDEAAIIVDVLEDIDAAHVRAMVRIRAAREAAEAAVASGKKPSDPRVNPIDDAGEAAIWKESDPVRAVLIRTGAIKQIAAYAGVPVLVGLSDFGMALLREIEAASD